MSTSTSTSTLTYRPQLNNHSSIINSLHQQQYQIYHNSHHNYLDNCKDSKLIKSHEKNVNIMPTNRNRSMSNNSSEVAAGISLEQVLEDSNSVTSYKSDPTDDNGINGLRRAKPKFLKSYLHLTKKKTIASSPEQSPSSYHHDVNSSSNNVIDDTNTTANTLTSISKPLPFSNRNRTASLPGTTTTSSSSSLTSRKQYKQPRKAWEWHFRSFLSSSSNNNNSNTKRSSSLVGSKLSKIIHTIKPTKQHGDNEDEMDRSSDSTTTTASSSIKKIRNRLFTKSQSSNDLSSFNNNQDPLQISHGKRNKQHIKENSSMRKTFTTYHNSRDFGKDTTSAYLSGSNEEDTSSHYHEQNFYSFYYKLSSYNPPSLTSFNRKQSYSPSFLLASSEPLDTLVEGRNYNETHTFHPHNHMNTVSHEDSPDCIADIPSNGIDAIDDNTDISNINRIPLFPINGFESWNKHNSLNNNDDNSEKLILPAVLRMCPVSVVTYLLSDNNNKAATTTFAKNNRNSNNVRSGLAQMLEPLSDDDDDNDNNKEDSTMKEEQTTLSPSSSIPLFSSLHKIKLGNAKVTILNNKNMSKNLEDNYYYNNNHFQSTFYIAMNYLYEYTNTTRTSSSSSKNNLLPRSITHLHNAIITKHDNFSNAFEIVIKQCTIKKHLVITCNNVIERNEWVDKLIKAGKLDIDDIYDYDLGGDDILGTGRYATIVPATYKDSTSTSSSSFLPTFNNYHARKRIAIKIIDKPSFFERVSRSKERIDTLVREVAIQTTLSIQESKSSNSTHLQLKNVFETSNKLVLELELLNGMDLFTYISTYGIVNEYKAAWIIRDLLVCCSAMKRRGIAHRDIKPANILVSDDLLLGTDNDEHNSTAVSVKLGDYGMSTFCGIDDLCHGRCGTPGYVAPEILKATINSRYSNCVDVFSIGVTLYVLLCGYEPFYGENDAELIQVNKEGYFDFLPDDDWCNISDDAKDLICLMMEKDPLKRITADMALMHPWIINYAPSDTLSSLHTTSDYNNTCTIC